MIFKFRVTEQCSVSEWLAVSAGFRAECGEMFLT
jgi:hypothetical protein